MTIESFINALGVFRNLNPLSGPTVAVEPVRKAPLTVNVFALLTELIHSVSNCVKAEALKPTPEIGVRS